MKIALTLALALILLASSAYASSSAGSVVIDILGSKTDNIQVVSGTGPADLEIIGSTSSNTRIAPPPAVIPDYQCGYWCYPNVRCNGTKPSYPWDSMHLGVDAWYGTYWYTNVYMPKWPQV
jgi:hypothetical protein